MVKVNFEKRYSWWLCRGAWLLSICFSAFCAHSFVTFQGNYEEAEPLYERSLAIDEQVHGPDSPEVASGLNNRALLLESQVRAASQSFPGFFGGASQITNVFNSDPIPGADVEQAGKGPHSLVRR